MPFLSKLSSSLPSWKGILLAIISSLLLTASFPRFELYGLAWVSFVPLLLSFRQRSGSFLSDLVKGWLFGTLFFFLTCWWLTFAPITYAGFPVLPTYLLLFAVSAASGIFAGVFSAIYGFLRRRTGPAAVLSAPFLWTASEFARYWITGNNWNAVGYSQAFSPALIGNASIGGVYLTGFVVVFSSCLAVFLISGIRDRKSFGAVPTFFAAILLVLAAGSILVPIYGSANTKSEPVAELVAVQPNVPMAGLDPAKWKRLRARQTELAEKALAGNDRKEGPRLVVFPESPMNYQYDSDPEFREFINDFAKRNDAAVLFNSAEPDPSRERGYFNSAVFVSPEGRKTGQYDKIHLLPFGEFVPLPEFAQNLIPPMVGRFSHGTEYDLFEIGGAWAGVMICFESHFASLSAEYARNGADLLIEMTNDGYLGETPVLRQHLANAVFRATETRLPVLRVTNVGITAKISERGVIEDSAKQYSEATRVWQVNKAGSRNDTIYVRFGDWFAVLSCIFTLAACAGALALKPQKVR